MLSLKPEDEKSLHPEALKWLLLGTYHAMSVQIAEVDVEATTCTMF